MKNLRNRSRLLGIVGLVAMILGALDPVEGSVVILAGVMLAAIGARLGHSRYRAMLLWSLGLVALGVAALFGMSALGGVGGSTGRSIWWLLVLVPYPAGWIVGLVGAIKRLREPPRPA